MTFMRLDFYIFVLDCDRPRQICVRSVTANRKFTFCPLVLNLNDAFKKPAVDFTSVGKKKWMIPFIPSFQVSTISRFVVV